MYASFSISSFDPVSMNIKCLSWIICYGFWIGSKWLNMYCYFIRRRSKVSCIVIQRVSFLYYCPLAGGPSPLFCITISNRTRRWSARPSPTVRLSFWRGVAGHPWTETITLFWNPSSRTLLSGWFFECNTIVNIKRSYQEN